MENYLIAGMIAVAIMALCVFAIRKLFAKKKGPDSNGYTPGSGRKKKPTNSLE